MNLLVKSFYVGEYARQIDEKGRVPLPSKWRPDADTELLLALPNPIGCITIYPPAMVARLEEKVASVSLGDLAAQKALAKLFSRADTFACDSKGRIKLENRLLDFAGIRSEALFVGGGAVFNIWEPTRFQDYIEEEKSEDIPEILKGLGL